MGHVRHRRYCQYKRRFPVWKSPFCVYNEPSRQTCLHVVVYLANVHHRTNKRDDIYVYLEPSCQNATALAAATFNESTPWDMGMQTL